MSKRYKELIDSISSTENLELADMNARRNKHYTAIKKFDEDRDMNLALLSVDLGYPEQFHTSPYKTFKIFEPKERLIFKLPYYPDRITHHAIMNVLKPIWTNQFVSRTYSCIEKRGTIACAKRVKYDLKRDPEHTKYCLKLDIRKFYPSINHDILKQIIRKKIKCKNTLSLLDEIIDSCPIGVPIGNYLSQYFANLYLSDFDKWCLKYVKYYYRYADDIVILHHDKQFLHNLFIAIKFYIHLNLDLEIKGDYQIYPVYSRGIDFVGYVFYHTHTLLRKSIKKNIEKLMNAQKRMSKKKFELKMKSYFGLLKICDSKHYLQKIEEKTGLHFSNFDGKPVSMKQFKNRRRTIRVIHLNKHRKYFTLEYIMGGKPYILKSKNRRFYRYLYFCGQMQRQLSEIEYEQLTGWKTTDIRL